MPSYSTSMPRTGGRRRATPAQDATTPTRPQGTNALIGAIPPIMLQTPPHAPFLTSPLPPVNLDAHHDRTHHNHNLRNHISPTTNDNSQDAAQLPQSTADTVASAMSDTEPADDDSLLESAPHDPDDSKQLVGLRDISALASWTLSSSKPGCALAQLRHPSPTHFWQSDGPQPHTLTLHFFKLVAIVKMRIYLDFELDESYTPTKMKFYGGMSEGGLVEFATWEVPEGTDPETGEPTTGVEHVRGWIDVNLKGVGGRDTRQNGSGRRSVSVRKSNKEAPAGFSNIHIPAGEDGEAKDDMLSMSDEDYDNADDDYDVTKDIGGDVLKAMVVQVRICENHQNGKDTHVRGFQVFARDENSGKDGRRMVKRSKRGATPLDVGDDGVETEVVGIQEADWMGEPELR